MKRIIIFLCFLTCFFTLVSCSFQEKDILHLGVNAIITEVDISNKTISVKDHSDEGILGKNCLIDCSEVPIIYCNYDTGEVKDISFEDLQVDDEVILNIRSSELKSLQEQNSENKITKIEQLQLGTQRIE